MPRKPTLGPKAKAENRSNSASNHMKKKRLEVRKRAEARQNCKVLSSSSESESDGQSQSSDSESSSGSPRPSRPRKRPRKNWNTESVHKVEQENGEVSPAESEIDQDAIVQPERINEVCVQQETLEDPVIVPSDDECDDGLEADQSNLDDSFFGTDVDTTSGDEQSEEDLNPTTDPDSNQDQESEHYTSNGDTNSGTGSDADSSSQEEAVENTAFVPPSQPIPYNLKEPVVGDPTMEFYRAITSVKARHEVSDTAIGDLLKVFCKFYLPYSG